MRRPFGLLFLLDSSRIPPQFLLARIGADKAENELNFAIILNISLPRHAENSRRLAAVVPAQPCALGVGCSVDLTGSGLADGDTLTVRLGTCAGGGFWDR